MVLEIMRGGELFDRIRRKISFTENEASDITRQVPVDVIYKTEKLDKSQQKMCLHYTILRPISSRLFLPSNTFVCIT